MKLPLRALVLFFTSISILAPSLAYADTTASSTESLEASIVQLTNADRVAHGDSPLTISPLLSLAAQEKADTMAAEGYFAHTTPNGNSPWYWFTSVGYHYTHAGENLAIHFNDPTSLEAAWMASPGHRANILKRVYTQMGVGIAHGTYHGTDTTFYVVEFATPAA